VSKLEAKWSVTDRRSDDGLDHSTVCFIGVEELAADETPADRDHVRAADAVDNAERHAHLPAVYHRHDHRHTDELPAVFCLPSADVSPAAVVAPSRHGSATGNERIPQHVDGRVRAE